MEDQLAMILGLGAQTITALLQTYTVFRKTNVEMYFKKLLNENVSIKEIGQSEELRRYFFSIVDEVSTEASTEKIEKWKNATVHLATDFKDFDFKDTFIHTLENLTIFDLTVLSKIYSTDFKKDYFEKEIVNYFKSKDVNENYVFQSFKRLASYNLVNEMFDKTAVWADSDGEPILGNMYYTKNELGNIFLRFIADTFIDIT